MPRSVTVLHLTRAMGRMQAQLGTNPQRDGQYKLCPLLCPVPHPWALRIGTCVLKVDVALHGSAVQSTHTHTSGYILTALLGWLLSSLILVSGHSTRKGTVRNVMECLMHM